MPALENPFDEAAAAELRASQEDPLVMYLLFDKTRRLWPDEALIAAAQATVKCAAKFRADPNYAELFGAWDRSSYRKVALSADPDTIRFFSEQLGVTQAADESVLALPPRYRSLAEPQLQALRPVSDIKSPKQPAEHQAHEVTSSSMHLVVNSQVQMNTGKLMAQAAHAALMCSDSTLVQDPLYTESFKRWRASGYLMTVEHASVSKFEWFKQRTDCVVVRDAGFTQVPSGSETMLALPPGAGNVTAVVNEMSHAARSGDHDA